VNLSVADFDICKELLYDFLWWFNNNLKNRFAKKNVDSFNFKQDTLFTYRFIADDKNNTSKDKKNKIVKNSTETQAVCKL